MAVTQLELYAEVKIQFRSGDGWLTYKARNTYEEGRIFWIHLADKDISVGFPLDGIFRIEKTLQHGKR